MSQGPQVIRHYGGTQLAVDGAAVVVNGVPGQMQDRILTITGTRHKIDFDRGKVHKIRIISNDAGDAADTFRIAFDAPTDGIATTMLTTVSTDGSAVNDFRQFWGAEAGTVVAELEFPLGLFRLDMIKVTGTDRSFIIEAE